tara:strand:- start:543 stop:752 length:210 start_codon:yes stop_codon:yes gene_type:complete
MENVSTGHWIFAGIFGLLFIGFLIWSYRKDLALHKIHYKKTYYITAGIVVTLFLFYVLKQMFSYYKDQV